MAMRERVGSFFRINRWLIVSLVALGAAVYVSTHYVRDVLDVVPRTNQTSPQPEATVVVARTNLPAYSVITAGDITVETVPASLVPPGAISASSQVVGQWTDEAVSAGVPIVHATVFAPQSANILAARIQPGDMAVDLPLTANQVVDGLVEPGDTISLFETITEQNGQQASEDFLNTVKVLAVNGSLTPVPATAGQNLTLILALPPRQVTELLFMQQKGSIEAVLDAPNAVTKPPIPFGTAQWQKPTPSGGGG